MLSSFGANDGKSSMFCVGMSLDDAKSISAFLRFPLASLPIHYHDLHFISGRLSYSYCLPQLEIITTHVKSWYARALSYVGRLQHIHSVLQSF